MWAPCVSLSPSPMASVPTPVLECRTPRAGEPVGVGEAHTRRRQGEGTGRLKLALSLTRAACPALPCGGGLLTWPGSPCSLFKATWGPSGTWPDPGLGEALSQRWRNPCLGRGGCCYPHSKGLRGPEWTSPSVASDHRTVAELGARAHVSRSVVRSAGTSVTVTPGGAGPTVT